MSRTSSTNISTRAPSERFYRIVADGLVVTVRLTPKSGRDSIDGGVRLSDGSEVLAARVRAAPSDGAANAALTALLAKTLRLPKSAVTLIAGDSARLKRLHIAGDVSALSAMMKQWSSTG